MLGYRGQSNRPQKVPPAHALQLSGYPSPLGKRVQTKDTTADNRKTDVTAREISSGYARDLETGSTAHRPIH